MTGDAPVSGRRLLIAVGVGTYAHDAIPDLPGVPHDVRRVRGLLEPMGYETVLPELAADPTAQQLREDIGKWAAGAELGPSDVVVLYFAGHGVKDPDRHYLLCSTSEPGAYDSTALPSEDLGRALVKSEVGQLLMVLDTCYAAEGAGEVARIASQLARFQRGAAGRWMLASARSKDKARENAFVDALTEVLEQPQLGVFPEFVGVREVTYRINRHYAADGLTQQARLSTIESDGYAPFFRNRDHIPALAGRALEGETLRRLRTRTRGHFETRGRGVGSLEEKGDYFTGRTAVLDELTDWLASPRHDGRARVVTGDPGSGKSAVLGRLLARVADQHHVVQLHARHTGLESLVGVLAEVVRKPGAPLDGLLRALSEREDHNPVTVVVDALDEAGAAGDTREGRLVARRLLRPLSVLPAVRLIVGTRRSLLAELGDAVDIIDLDERVSRDEIAEYARKVLLDAADPTSVSPYRGAPEAAGHVARGIALRAGTSYLVARMTARALIREPERIDTTGPGWEGRLPSSADAAFEAYLARFGPKRAAVERMLRPLAYAQGAGLPWSTVWASVAEALSGEPCSEEELRHLHEHAGTYVVETRTPTGDSAFRLFHESLAEYLRGRGPHDMVAHQAITKALTRQVRVAPESGARDWAAAHPYVRDHLATHAAAGGVLDSLLRDTEFLLHAAPAHLNRVLDSAVAPECRQRAAVYRASYAAHAEAPVRERRDILAIDAARYGEAELSQECARGRGWRPRWATGALINPALRGTLEGHPHLVEALDCTLVDGRPHVVTGVFGGSGVEVWDLTDETRRAVLHGHTGSVDAVSCVVIDGVPHALSGGEDGTLRLWNLADDTEVLVCHVGPVKAITCVTLDGRLCAAVVTGSSTSVWDLVDGTRRTELARFDLAVASAAVVNLGGRPQLVAAPGYGRRAFVKDLGTGEPWRTWRSRRFRLRATRPQALASTVIDGDPHAVVCGFRKIEVWNLATGARRWSFRPPDCNFPTTAICTMVGNSPHLLVAYEKTVGVWNLINGEQRATLTGHTQNVTTVACATLYGRPHAVTGGGDGIRIWDLTAATLQTARTGHTGSVESVSCLMIDGKPHALTGDRTGHLRVWPLTTDAPEPTRSTDVGSWVSASACAVVDNESLAVVGTADGHLYVWNLARNRRPKRTAAQSSRWVRALTRMDLDDRPRALWVVDVAVFLWDLATDRRPKLEGGDSSGWVSALTCTDIDGRPHALWAVDATVHLRDLARAAPRPPLRVPAGTAYGLACTVLDGRPHVLTSTLDRMNVWDLADRSDRTEEFGGGADGAKALVCADIDGRPHVVIGGYDTVSVRALDGSARTTALDTRPALDLDALACTTIDGQPHAVMAFSRVQTKAGDYEIRKTASLQIWNLTTRRLVETIRLAFRAESIAAHGPDIVIGMADEVVVLTRAQPRS